MRIANTVNDSIVDGPGLRFTVFTQGCPHGCPGCHNPETHDPAGGVEMDVEELEKLLKKNPLIDGLTLSGGEPFWQAEECARLAGVAKELGLTVWTYTGFLYENILKANRPDWNKLLKETDVLVDGPYLAKERAYGLPFRGSRNQRLIDVSESCARGQVVLLKREDTLQQFVIPKS